MMIASFWVASCALCFAYGRWPAKFHAVITWFKDPEPPAA